MKNHSSMASRIIGILGMAVAVGWLQPTAAYGQTAENTVITNMATVSFTDANSNTYSSVNGSVNVTVGHAAGIDVVAVQGTATPVSPSTLNTLDFYVINIGNGIDTVSVAEDISDGTVFGLTKYTYNSTDYANVGLLNAALLLVSLNATDTVAITITYEIFDDKGGVPSTFTLTGTSIRDGTATDDGNTVVTPALTGSVETTPDGGQNITQLPSNAGNYTFTFTVWNDQTGPDDFNLVATSPGSVVIGIVSVNGVGGTSTTITLGAGVSQDIDVIYTVADVAAGIPDTLYLAATSVAPGAINDSGFADLTVIKASLTIVKEAYRDNQTTLLGGGDTVLPGEFIQYLVTVTNGGTAPASNVQVVDVLPSELTYDSATEDVPTWTFAPVGNTLTSDLTGPLAASASRFFWIRVRVN